MRLTPSDTVDLMDLNRTFRRPSSSHGERILRRNLPPASFYEDFALAALSTFSTESANSRRLPLLAVPPQTASVQLSENANADVEKGRPSRSRGQDCPLASMPFRTRRVPSAGINTVHTP